MSFSAITTEYEMFDVYLNSLYDRFTKLTCLYLREFINLILLHN